MLLEMNKAHYRERGGRSFRSKFFLKKIKGEREGGEGEGNEKQPLLQLKKQKQSRAVIE